MDRLRTLIVDDEPLARKLLRSMLDAHPEIEIVAECGDGASALEMLREEDIDLVFLDVQMPRLTGIEVLQRLGPDRPELVFVTAYDAYAIRAFEVNAVDYLLKPFDDERLAEAVERVRSRLQRPRTGDSHRIAQLLEQLGGRPDYLEHIAVKRGERIILQPVDRVELFESEGKYVRIHAGDEEHLIRETMLKLEEMLDPRAFLRISRSSIVNVRAIREIQAWVRGDYVVVLRGGQKVNTTRTYRDSLKALIDRVG